MTTRRALLAVIPVLSLAGTTACASPAPPSSTPPRVVSAPATSPTTPGEAYSSTLEISAPAPPNGATLAAEAFAAAMVRPDTILLDVRTTAEFAEGHLAGARNPDVESPDFETKVAALDRKVPYAVYCRSGNRSATAVEIMRGLGFTSTYHLGGGIGAWQASGRPVVN